MNADQPIRILFVEDIPADVELAERALKKIGINLGMLSSEAGHA